MKRLFLILIVLLGVLNLSPSPIRAQVSECRNRTWNFDSDTEGWQTAVANFSGYTGTAWGTGGYLYGAGRWETPDSSISAYFDFGETCSITNITISWRTEGVLGYPSTREVTTYNAAPVNDEVWYEQSTWRYYASESTGVGDWQVVTILDNAVATGRYLMLFLTAPHEQFVDWISIAATPGEIISDPLSGGGIGRALTQADETTLPSEIMGNGQVSDPMSGAYWQFGEPYPLQTETDNEYTITYLASEMYSDVHSLSGGIVQSIIHLGPGGCASEHLMLADPDFANVVSELEQRGASQTTVAYFQRLLSENLTFCAIRIENAILVQQSLFFAPEPMYFVSVEDSEHAGLIINYLVMDAPAFVSEGQIVQQGCVIGKTAPAFNDNASLHRYAVTHVWAETSSGAPYDLMGRMIYYPDDDTPCNQAAFGECYNANPYFTRPDDNFSWGWSFDDDNANRNPYGGHTGLMLVPDGSNNAGQILTLNPTGSYSILVQARVITPNSLSTDSEITVQLGQDTPHVITLPREGDTITFSPPLQMYEEIATGGLYDLRVEIGDNEPGAVIVVDEVCVDDELPIEDEATCLFLDPAFDTGEGWTPSTSPAPTFAPGTVAGEDGSYVEQEVTVPAGEWQIDYVARLEPGGDGTIELDWSFDEFTGTATYGDSSGEGSYTANLCSGGTASASGYLYSNTPANAFDNNNSTMWYSDTTNSGWLEYNFGTDQTIRRYTVRARADNTEGSPTAWTFQYYDGSTWVTADTRSNQSGWTNGLQRTYDISSNHTASRWRINVSAIQASGGYPQIAEIEMMGYEEGEIVTTGTRWTELSDTFTVTSETTANFRFAADAPSAAGNALGITNVCLHPANSPVEFADACQVCSYTATGDVAADLIEIISWLACQIRNLWFCYIEPLVSAILDGILEAVRGIGMLGRFLSVTFYRLILWIESGIYYLAGHIDNAAARIENAIQWSFATNGVTIIQNEGYAGFWCTLSGLFTGIRDVLVIPIQTLGEVLISLFTSLRDVITGLSGDIRDVLVSVVDGLRDILVTLIEGLRDVLVTLLYGLRDVLLALLNILDSVAQALIGIIESLITSITNLFTMLADQMNFIRYLAQVVFDAANNASPQTISGAPNCASSQWYCVGFFVLDNTIFSGPVAALIPILLGASALNLVIWAIERFKVALAHV